MNHSSAVFVYLFHHLQRSGSSENLPGGANFIPQDRFTYLTLAIISGTLMLGILFPQGKCSLKLMINKILLSLKKYPLILEKQNSLVLDILLFIWELYYCNRNQANFLFFVVEFVLALTGATMGTLIAFIFPSTMFLHVVSEKTSARLIAKVCLHSPK